ncbi:MAG: hypothetical protein JWN98_2204, partial [Abditibacteriota bacterium]|nr:hypothetical protein [Abditibacteriota bacterium]
ATTDVTRIGFTDYSLNTNVRGQSLKRFASSQSTLLCGDGNNGIDTADARYNRNSLPKHWRTDTNSPARRHLDTANYLFVDGHVKSYKPNAIQNTAPPSRGKPTFAIR